MLTRINKIIIDQKYKGIMEQDGMETLGLTVRATETSEDAELIIDALTKTVDDVMATASEAAFIIFDNVWFRITCTIYEEVEKVIYFTHEDTGDELELNMLDEEDIGNGKTAVFYKLVRM